MSVGWRGCRLRRQQQRRRTRRRSSLTRRRTAPCRWLTLGQPARFAPWRVRRPARALQASRSLALASVDHPVSKLSRKSDGMGFEPANVLRSNSGAGGIAELAGWLGRRRRDRSGRFVHRQAFRQQRRGGRGCGIRKRLRLERPRPRRRIHAGRRRGQQLRTEPPLSAISTPPSSEAPA